MIKTTDDIEVFVKEIDEIKEHPNADKLELAFVDGKQFCVGIDSYQEGDLVAHIEPDMLIPQSVQEELGIEKYISNKKDDLGRVREKKLRGLKSQGLLYPAKEHWEKGQNVKEELGVKGFIRPVPSQIRGKVHGGLKDICISYDLNNYRHHQDSFEEGDDVVFMEKVHGTWCMMGVLPDSMKVEKFQEPYKNLLVSSKGLSKKGQAFLPTAKENKNNVYLRKAKQLDIQKRVKENICTNEKPIYILGELFGDGIQTLDYMHTTKYEDHEIGFRVFDIYIGKPGEGRFLSFHNLRNSCHALDLDMVPVLYEGDFEKDLVAKYRSGMEQVSGDEKHLREGIVIRDIHEDSKDYNLPMRRRQLKAKSFDYMIHYGHDVTDDQIRCFVVEVYHPSKNKKYYLSSLSNLEFVEKKSNALLFDEGFEDIQEILVENMIDESNISKEDIKIVSKL